MNREIEFRFYDKITKEMHYAGDGTKYCITATGCVCHDDTDYGGILENRGYKTLAMQYTGLKDMNGTKIFEGDIVRKMELDYDSDQYNEYMDCDDSDLLDNIRSKIPTRVANIDIVVMDRFPRFWLSKEEFGWEGEDLQCPDDYEVIGNIHQHQHLLEEVK